MTYNVYTGVSVGDVADDIATNVTHTLVTKRFSSKVLHEGSNCLGHII